MDNKADQSPDILLQTLQQSFHALANHLNAIAMQAELAKMLASRSGADTEAIEAIIASCSAAGELTLASELCAAPNRERHHLQRLQNLVKND